ncbi:MAG: ATP-binding protein [Pseudomonadota bacterium]
MTAKPSDPVAEEKTKSFRLVKYFSFSSLIVIFIGTLVLSMLNTHWARRTQLKQSEEFARLLIENLNHQVFLQFILPVVLKYGKVQLRDPEQYDRMDTVVRATLYSFNVEQVSIYDQNHTIAYSFDKSLLGTRRLAAKSYLEALRGVQSSRVIQIGSSWEIFFGIPKKSRMVSIAPLRAEEKLARPSGPILGIVEITQDLTPQYREIFQFQILIILNVAIVMMGLFVVLLLVVKRGESIIEKRALERMRLKERLAKAEHLSSLGEMVAGVSHEIRNPLGIILSSANLLRKQMPPADRLSHISNIILEEAGRLNGIITDFLNFARPQQPDLQSCSVESVLEKNINFLKTQIEGKGYDIHYLAKAHLPDIIADANMLYQAFLNIMLNAIQAMPGGGPIHIDLFEKDDHVHVTFTDSGPGIPETLIEKVWDPFFTTKDGGTGLGLGIVRKIILAHSGQIDISNAPGGGTHIAIRLPIRPGD